MVDSVVSSPHTSDWILPHIAAVHQGQDAVLVHAVDLSTFREPEFLIKISRCLVCHVGRQEYLPEDEAILTEVLSEVCDRLSQKPLPETQPAESLLHPHILDPPGSTDLLSLDSPETRALDPAVNPCDKDAVVVEVRPDIPSGLGKAAV